MKKCRLIYKSVASSELRATGALDRLAQDSSDRNEDLGINGLLVLSGHQILQVLEGPSRFVNRLFKNILNDTRHDEVELISYESIDAPLFSEWGMRFMDLQAMAPDVRELMLKKYASENGVISIPNNMVHAVSLLIDARDTGLTT